MPLLNRENKICFIKLGNRLTRFKDHEFSYMDYIVQPKIVEFVFNIPNSSKSFSLVARLEIYF